MEINDLVAKNMDIKVLSGTIKISNSYATNMDLKVTSGSLRVGSEYEVMKLPIEQFLISTRSGNAKIYGLKAKKTHFNLTSGNLKLCNASLGEATIKCSSGGIKGEEIIINRNLEVILKSGNIRLSRISFNSALVKANSGNLKLTNIKGTADDYAISASARSGFVKINGGRLASYGYKLVDKIPDKKIEATVTSGIIRLDFEK